MTTNARVLGHLALHYASGDEAPARRLLVDLGCTLVDNGPQPGSDGFCTVLLDAETACHAENLMFLAPRSPAQEALERTLCDTLRLGTDAADSSATAFAELKNSSPELFAHIGIRYAQLDTLEAVLLAVERDALAGGPLEGRVEVTRYRARPNLDPAVDARMASSPVFTGEEHPAYADYWVQCFVTTDLFAHGLLPFGQTIELDYVFEPFFAQPPSFG
jgi:hypothetical protein